MDHNVAKYQALLAQGYSHDDIVANVAKLSDLKRQEAEQEAAAAALVAARAHRDAQPLVVIPADATFAEQQELRAEAGRRPVVFAPSPRRTAATAMRERGVIPGGMTEPPGDPTSTELVVSRREAGSFLQRIEAIAAGKVAVR
jgi:hypothetical protein